MTSATETQAEEDRLAMALIKNVCVYCGSASGYDPAFSEAATQLGRNIAAAGANLVYGGGSRGLMGIVARTVAECGGGVTGIIPEFLTARESKFEEASELIVVPDMHTRKQLMFDKADAFVALPGGIGTLEELVEQLTWVQLDQHDKPVLLADVGGFWRPLLTLLEHMREHGFIRPGFEVRYSVAERMSDVMPMLEKLAVRHSRKGEPNLQHDPRLS